MSVPSSELGPPPSPARECLPAWNQRGGGHNHLRVKGWVGGGWGPSAVGLNVGELYIWESIDAMWETTCGNSGRAQVNYVWKMWEGTGELLVEKVRGHWWTVLIIGGIGDRALAECVRAMVECERALMECERQLVECYLALVECKHWWNVSTGGMRRELL